MEINDVMASLIQAIRPMALRDLDGMHFQKFIDAYNQIYMYADSEYDMNYHIYNLSVQDELIAFVRKGFGVKGIHEAYASILKNKHTEYIKLDENVPSGFITFSRESLYQFIESNLTQIFYSVLKDPTGQVNGELYTTYFSKVFDKAIP